MSENLPDKPTPEDEPRICPECQGRGWVDNRCLSPDHAHRCPICNGKGFDAVEKECYACQGTGLLEIRQEEKNPCPLCGGAGVFPVPLSLRARDFAYNPGRRTM